MIVVAAPLLALAVTLLLVYPAWSQLGIAQRDVLEKEKTLRTLQETQPRVERVIPAAEDRPGEPARFLGEINDLAAAAGCTFRNYDVQATSTPPPSSPPAGNPASGSPASGSPASGSPPAGSETSNVRPLQVKITLVGSYADIREFLARLARAPRIYTVTALSLAPETTSSKNVLPDERLVAILTIERYLVSAT